MLIPAISMEKELQETYVKYVYDEKYKFVCGIGNYRQLKIKIDDNDWNNLQFISYNGEFDYIIGYIGLSISRSDNIIDNIEMYNFTSDLFIFAGDLKQLFVKVFKEFNFPKVKFSVVVGNPVEKSYDNFIKKYNGTVVGTFKNDTLVDNKYYDIKWYEIHREEFLNSLKQ